MSHPLTDARGSIRPVSQGRAGPSASPSTVRQAPVAPAADHSPDGRITSNQTRPMIVSPGLVPGSAARRRTRPAHGREPAGAQVDLRCVHITGPRLPDREGGGGDRPVVPGHEELSAGGWSSIRSRVVATAPSPVAAS